MKLKRESLLGQEPHEERIEKRRPVRSSVIRRLAENQPDLLEIRVDSGERGPFEVTRKVGQVELTRVRIKAAADRSEDRKEDENQDKDCGKNQRDHHDRILSDKTEFFEFLLKFIEFWLGFERAGG